MPVGRRYRLKLDARQGAYAERVAGACRALWNAALEQRRTAAELNRHRTPERQHWPSLLSQSRELTEAKRIEDWLAEAPRECLQQTLRDLERACWQHHGPSGSTFGEAGRDSKILSQRARGTDDPR